MIWILTLFRTEEMLAENINFISGQLNDRNSPKNDLSQHQSINFVDSGTTQLRSESNAQSVKSLLREHPVSPRKFMPINV
jgi:hypothetical protein